ncbi:hypothetical protein [Clostridium novyi]|nr:hypothetical protein [Clostridium novyi]
MYEFNIIFIGISTFIKNERAPIISTKAQLIYKKRYYQTNGLMITR